MRKKILRSIKVFIAMVVMLANSVSALAAANGDVVLNRTNFSQKEKMRIQENEEKSFTEEEIAAMSPSELEYYQLLPLYETRSSARRNSARSMSYYSVSTTMVKQANYYYCGPAATLMALYTAGMAGTVTGNTNDQKQATLAGDNYLRTNSLGATYIYDVPDVLQDFTQRTRDWVAYGVRNDSTGKNALS